jgi:ribosome-associated translation inhibitor RaiA
METLAKKAMNKIASHFPAQRAHVAVETIKKEIHISATFIAENGQSFHADATQASYAKAVKDAQNKLLRQLRASKTNSQKQRKDAPPSLIVDTDIDESEDHDDIITDIDRAA